MKGRILKILLLLLIPFALVSCQGEEPQNNAPLKRAPRPKKKPEPQVTVEEKKEFVVETIKRNPFMNFMVKKGIRKESKRVKGPLECCDVKLFRLLAVVSGIDMPRAVVQAPDNKKYIVKIGDRMGLNDGRIVHIDRGSITVREKIYNEFGEVVGTNDVKLSLPSEDKKRQSG